MLVGLADRVPMSTWLVLPKVARSEGLEPPTLRSEV